MTPVESLREFVNERLSAAAEEIFGVFKKTIDVYEREIDRQRRLADSERNLNSKLHTPEPPQQLICKKEPQLSNQENFSQGQEDLDDPHIEEEYVGFGPRQKDEPIEVKLETDTFIITPSYEEANQCKEETTCLMDTLPESGTGAEPSWTVSVQSTTVSEASTEHQLLSNVGETQEHTRGECGDVGYDLQLFSQCSKVEWPEKSEANKNEETRQNNQYLASYIKNNNKSQSKVRRSLSRQRASKSGVCPICGKTFHCKKYVNIHMLSHSGEKPCLCKTCGKRFTSTSTLNRHLKTHTGERPHICETCGKGFPDMYRLKAHTQMHTTERQYVCQVCKKEFKYNETLKNHMRRAHTDERPYECKTCGMRFSELRKMKRHMRIHEREDFEKMRIHEGDDVEKL